MALSGQVDSKERQMSVTLVFFNNAYHASTAKQIRKDEMMMMSVPAAA